MFFRRTIFTMLISFIALTSGCSTRNLLLTYDDIREEEKYEYQSQHAQGDISPNSVLHKIDKVTDVSVQYYIPKGVMNKLTKVTPNKKTFYLLDGADFNQAVDKLMPRYFPKATRKTHTEKAQLFFSLYPQLEIDAYSGQYTATVHGSVFDASGNQLYQSSFNMSKVSHFVNNSYVAYGLYTRVLDTFLSKTLEHIGTQKIRSLPIATFSGYNDIKSPGLSGTGSAFYINDSGYLLTAAHVIDSCSHIDIQNENKVLNTEPVEVISSNRYLDIAILKADFHSSTYGKLASKDNIGMGDDVLVFGYPLGSTALNTLQMTKGLISSTGTEKSKSSAYIQFSAPIRSGNSGGVVTNSYGIVGITQAALNKDKLKEDSELVLQGNMNFGLASHVMERYAERHNIPYHTQIAELDKSDIIEHSQQYVVQINCY